MCRYGDARSNGTGEGTTIYVVDSGIKLDHQEFKNDLGTKTRASYGALHIPALPCLGGLPCLLRSCCRVV
jgi:hypothetical protein